MAQQSKPQNDEQLLAVDIHDDEIRLAYQPESNTKNLRDFLSQNKGILAALTLFSPLFGVFGGLAYWLFFGTIGPSSYPGASTSWLALPWFFIAVTPLTIPFAWRLLRIIFQPTHLLIRPQGIFVKWQQRLGQPVKPISLWYELSYIDLVRIENKTKDSEQFLVFKSRAGSGKKVKLSAFIEPSARTELLKAIRKYVPEVPRNPEVTNLLEPPAEHGYTELWLNALTASPERESLTPLHTGAELKQSAYKIIRKIAMGGQGTAYAAVCLKSENPEELVVLKEYILPTHVGMKAKNESIETLKNEAEILGKVSHPNIVKLRDYFVEDHRGYLVLEHIEGTNLRDLVANGGPLKETEVCKLAIQMCNTLAFLHAQAPPIVHRDFTPDNLILTSQGELKLIDFNVARQTNSTVTATVVGKHAYIPLEQFRGKPVPQSDIFALGCILHYLLTGQDPEPLSMSSPANICPDISSKMNSIVEKATALECSSRYVSADDLSNDIQALANNG